MNLQRGRRDLIKSFFRPFLVSQNNHSFGGVQMAKNCVECGSHVPAYMNYLCEECWKIALNEKLNEDKPND
jgi:hypothetical protein